MDSETDHLPIPPDTTPPATHNNMSIENENNQWDWSNVKVDPSAQLNTGENSPVGTNNAPDEYDLYISNDNPAQAPSIDRRNRPLTSAVNKYGKQSQDWIDRNRHILESEGWTPAQIDALAAGRDQNTPGNQEPENVVSPEINRGPKKTYGIALGELTQLQIEISQRGGAPTPQESDQMAQLGQRISEIRDKAKTLKEYTDVHSNLQGVLRARLLKLKANPNVTDDEINQFEQSMKNVRGKNPSKLPTGMGETPQDMAGVIEDMVFEEKEVLLAEFSAFKSARSTSPELIFAQVVNGQKGFGDRYVNVELLSPDNQEKALDLILSEFEREKSVSPLDSRNNGKMDALKTLLAKESLDNDVRARAKARLDLQTCAVVVRRKVRQLGDRISENQINFVEEMGDYALNKKDFQVLLKDGLPGLKIKEAFSVLQEAGYAGLFAGKTTDAEFRDQLIDSITLTFGPSNGPDDYAQKRKRAEKSYEMAMSIADATFERSVWDTTGKYDFVSQAIYPEAYRGAKSKGHADTFKRIQFPFTSFLRSVTHQDIKEKSLAFDGERSRALASTDLKEKRIKMLSMQRIVTDIDATTWAETYRYKTPGEIKAMAHGGKIDLDAFDFDNMADDAYKSYIDFSLKDMVEIKKLFNESRVDIAKALGDAGTLAEVGKKLDKVDPFNVFNLRYWYVVNNAGVALDEVAGTDARFMATLLRQTVYPTGGDRVSPFLPAKLGNPPIETVKALYNDTNVFFLGSQNARIKDWAQINLYDLLVAGKVGK